MSSALGPAACVALPGSARPGPSSAATLNAGTKRVAITRALVFMAEDSWGLGWGRLGLDETTGGKLPRANEPRNQVGVAGQSSGVLGFGRAGGPSGAGGRVIGAVQVPAEAL